MYQSIQKKKMFAFEEGIKIACCYKRKVHNI